MSRKLEIRTRMAELQREFSSLNSEMKEMDELEKRTAARDRYQPYKFKIGSHGYEIEAEEKVENATDADREIAQVGLSGLIYSGHEGHSHFGYILMKEKTDYARAKCVLIKLDAVNNLKDDKVKDKEKYIKVLLGETDGEKS